jgi:hypothetical protein
LDIVSFLEISNHESSSNRIGGREGDLKKLRQASKYTIAARNALPNCAIKAERVAAAFRSG